MLKFVLLLVVLFSAASAAATCSKPGGECPCLKTTNGHLCPDNTACIIDPKNDDKSICCALGDIQWNLATAAPTTTARAATCVDKVNPNTGVSDCPQRAYLCNNPAYYDLMTDQCPKTCNRCGVTVAPRPPTAAPSSTCQDKLNPHTGVFDCPASAYLCQNPSYKALMKDQCPKTCGYCH